jgi:hypothetical protein
MLKLLYRCVFLVTGVFLALAALEIHGEDSQNTFFDQDDIYIKEESQFFLISNSIEKQNGFSKDLSDFAAALCDLFSTSIYSESHPLPEKIVAFNSQKIFLRNSDWRI